MEEQKYEIQFDLTEWQEKLKVALANALKELLEEYDGVYAMSLMLSSDLWAVGIAANTTHFLLEQAKKEDLEDYLYYKYAEEEWGIAEGAEEEFEELSMMLQDCINENVSIFTDEDYMYTEAYQEFRDQILGCSLRVFKEFVENGEGRQYPEMSWNFYVRDLFDAEEMLELYQMLNQDETRIEEFRSTLELS